MISINKDTYIPSVEETLGILNVHNQHLPQFIDFDKVVQYLSFMAMKNKQIEGPLFEMLKYSNGMTASLDNVLKSWLVNSGNASGFKTVKTGISLAKDSVEAAIESGRLSDEAKVIIGAWQQYNNNKKTMRTLEGLLQHDISNAYSFDNHRMLIVRPTWSAQNTGRVAMSNPAIQNLPRTVQDIITVPKGYTLLHTDSGQIEPRTVYSAYIKDPQIQTLIKLYNDAYFGVLHYITMPESDIASGRLDFTPMEITDEMKENRKRLKTYSNAVMYGSTSNASADPIKDAMIKRIGGHPLRQAWVRNLNEQIARGVRKFSTAFGTLIDISNSQKLDRIDSEYFDGSLDNKAYSDTVSYELTKLAINNPIQGTAADLMRVSVSKANALLMQKAKKSYIINYVHDAGTFAIHDDDYDKIADELADIVHYEVEGWVPILAEPEFGRSGGMFADLY